MGQPRSQRAVAERAHGTRTPASRFRDQSEETQIGKLDSIMRQVKLRGVRKVDWFFRLLASAANLVRMVKLIPTV